MTTEMSAQPVKPEDYEGVPTFVLDHDTMQTTISWPNGRAQTVAITGELLERIVEDMNSLNRLVRLQARLLREYSHVPTPVVGRIEDRREISDLQERLGLR